MDNFIEWEIIFWVLVIQNSKLIVLFFKWFEYFSPVKK